MANRWRRVEKMPIAVDDEPLGIQRYTIRACVSDAPDTIYQASTYEEAQALATHLRTTDAQIVTIARVEDAWKRQ